MILSFADAGQVLFYEGTIYHPFIQHLRLLDKWPLFIRQTSAVEKISLFNIHRFVYDGETSCTQDPDSGPV